MFLLKLSKKIITPFIVLTFIFSNFNIIQVRAESNINEIQFVDELIALTNEQRSIFGAGDLKRNDLLMRAAQKKAENMAELGYFAHMSPTGITPWQWFYGVGYKPLKAGENLALAYTENILIVNSWMNSLSHKKIC